MKMLSRVEESWRVIAIVMAIAAVSVSGLAYAQEPDPSQRDQVQRRGFDRGQFDPAQMQQRMLERMQRVLQMNDEEWQVVSPLLSVVMQAQVQGRMGGMAFGRGGPRGGGQRGPGQRGGGDGAGQGRPPRGNGEVQGRPPREGRGPDGGRGGQGGRWGGARFGPPPSPEAIALNEVLESEDTPPDQLRAKMAAFRSARARKDLELKKAREELREVLTLRQEARLVAMGMLD